MLHAGGDSIACFMASTACNFFGPHVRCSPALRQNQRRHRLVGALRRMVRPVTARLQTRQTEFGVALQMFVAGLAADAELLAQIGPTKTPAAREHHESIDLFHTGYGFPGHTP